MSVTTGSTGIDATAATTLYGVLASAMTGNGNWTEQSDSPVSAANAGTTDIVRVWKCTGGVSDFYVFIEVDDTNNRLRFRLSEYWDTTAHRLRQPAGGGTVASAVDTAAITPTANGTVTDSDTTIGSTNPNVSYVEVKTLGTSFGYLYEVRDNLITVATRVSGANYYAVAGCFTTLMTALTDTPLVLLGHPTSPGLSGTAETAAASNNGRFTRLPGFGAVAITGGFACSALTLFHLGTGNASLGADKNTFGSIGGTVSNPWFSNHLVTPAMLQCMESGNPPTRRGMRGYLPDFICGYNTNEPAAITDTITVSGNTYYPIGRCRNGGNSQAGWFIYLAIKG